MRLAPAVLVLVFVSSAAAAQVCSANALSTELQYFRRLSLDLRGRAPTLDELDAVANASRVTPATVDAMLTNADAKRLLRAYVRSLIWGNIRVSLQQDFLAVRTVNGTPEVPASDALWILNRAQRYRPLATGPAPLRQPCRDVPQSTYGYDANGRPNAVDTGDGYLREGYVMVHPYWEPNPATQVKVCAFDAQAALASNVAPFRSCGDHASSYLHLECGCGPELRFCQGISTANVFTETLINDALIEQAMRLVDRIVDEHRPWSDLLTLKELEVNGPLAHYLRYQTGTTIDFASRGDLGFIPPSRPFTDPAWSVVPVTGRSSGVLTTPLYLLKFASNRARANRFLDAFTCTALQAPPGGLPGANDPCSTEPDLSKRCGCSACHRALEPGAAAWGRYAERGTFELRVPEFPDSDPSCIAPDGGTAPMSSRCETFYRTRALHPAEGPWVGKLKGLLYLADAGVENFAAGPGGWAGQVVNRGDFAECTVRKFWDRLIGRPFVESLQDERDQLARLKADFIAGNHDVTLLLRAIVKTPQYRNAESPIGGLTP